MQSMILKMFPFQSFNIYSPTNTLYAVVSRRNTMMQRRANTNRTLLRLTVTASIIHSPASASSAAAAAFNTNVVGILGGDCCLNFAKKLVVHDSNLPFILCVDPALSNDLLLSSLDRRSSIIENLRCKRAILEKCGVCCIVMPCHALHPWQDEIAEGCSVPFIHMGESVAEELKEAKLKPVEAGSPLSVGVLATNTMLVTRMYRDKLQDKGFEVVMPDKNTTKHIVIPAVEALGSRDMEGARTLLRISVHILLVRAVNRIVLACDELRELLPPDDPLWTKCIDPMDALARSAVKYAQSTKSS